MRLPNLAAPVQRANTPERARQNEAQASIKPSWYKQWDCNNGSGTPCSYGADLGPAYFGCIGSDGHCHYQTFLN